MILDYIRWYVSFLELLDFKESTLHVLPCPTLMTWLRNLWNGCLVRKVCWKLIPLDGEDENWLPWKNDETEIVSLKDITVRQHEYWGGMGIASHDGICTGMTFLQVETSLVRHSQCCCVTMPGTGHWWESVTPAMTGHDAWRVTPHVKLESLLGGPEPSQLDCWKLLVISESIYQSLGKRTHWESIKLPWNHNGWSNFMDHHIGLFGSLQLSLAKEVTRGVSESGDCFKPSGSTQRQRKRSVSALTLKLTLKHNKCEVRISISLL